MGAHGYVRTMSAVGFLVGEEAFESEGLAVVPANVLVFMKLKAKRRRGLVDVVELVRAGMDVKPVREYLAQHAPELVKLFDELCDEALRQDS